MAIIGKAAEFVAVSPHFSAAIIVLGDGLPATAAV
jgi:hypothetical protein